MVGSNGTSVERIEFDSSDSVYGRALAFATIYNLDINAQDALIAEARERGCLHKSRFDVVQVGAHVGNSTNAAGEVIDPVYELLSKRGDLSALLVEPLRRSFELLVANYDASPADLTFVQAAIDLSVGAKKIYEAPPARDYDNRRADTTQIASLKEKNVAMHFGSAFPALSEQIVASFDWPTLFAVYDITTIGHLVMDAEGLDCQLIAAFPFHLVRPHLITLEHRHCDGPFSASSFSNRIVGLLRAHGYTLAKSDPDNATFVLVPKTSQNPEMEAATSYLFANG